MKKRILFLLFFLSLKIFGQNEVDYYLKCSELINEGNYLGYLQYIENNPDKLVTPEFLGDAYSYVGNYPYALKIYNNQHMIDELKNEKSKFDSKDFKNYTKKEKQDVFDEISKIDFLLVNEGHFRNYHRIFLRDHFQKLYQLGFRNLFVEGVVDFDTNLNERKYPLINTLTYPEPIYGELIREALLLGFKVYGYDVFEETPQIEDPIESWNFRENLQHKNILKNYDGNKTIIYGGYSHTITNNNSSKHQFLGALLKKDYKVLSIDQTIFVEESTKEIEKDFYTKNASSDKPIFFKNDNSSSYDYTLIYPRTQIKDKKPNWLINNKKKGSINWKSIKTQESILVQVFKTNEFEQNKELAIPIYQFVEKYNGSYIPYYFNIKKHETLVIRDSKNKILLKKKL